MFVRAAMILAASLACAAAHATAIDVVVADGANQVPGLHGDELPRAILHGVEHVASHDFAVELAPTGKLPPNRIEWRFHANPYAGGAVRYIGPARPTAERLFGMHRQVTAEAKLFLDGKFQRSAFGQASLAANGDTASFSTLIESLTDSVLHAPHG